jgi:uncharacterized protein involved in exopolysaccharide biosynthesis
MNISSRPDLTESAPSEVGYVTLPDIFRAMVEMRIAIALIITLPIVVAVTVALVFPPQYRASVVMIPAESGGNAEGLSLPGGLAGLASLAGVRIPQGQDATVEALAVLQSRQFTESFIRDENLLPVLFSEKWDRTKNRWTAAGKRIPTLADGYRYFDDKIRRISQDRKTNIVTLSIEWHDRTAAAEWATKLVSRLNSAMRQRAMAEADESITVLQERLRSASVVSLQQALAQLLESQIRQRTIATVREDYVFRVIDPAVVADEDDIEFPRIKVLLAIGASSGLVLAGLLVVVRASQRVRV